MPSDPQPTRPPDPDHVAILVGGEIHASADGMPLTGCHDFGNLERSLATAREQGFRDVALELSRDFQPLVDHFLVEAQALYAPDRKSNEDGHRRDENIARSVIESWVKTWEQAIKRYQVDPRDGFEWGSILMEVAWINAGNPEEPIRPHCIDVPIQKQVEAWKNGDRFYGVEGLPQSCQREIDRYVSRAEALAREGKRPSGREEKELGEGLLSRLQEGNPSFGQNSAERSAFFAQVSLLCRGGKNAEGIPFNGLDQIAAARAAHPERGYQVKTEPVDNSTYWREIHSTGASYPHLASKVQSTSQFLDARDRSMAGEIARIAASTQKETPCFGILSWNGLFHLGPSGRSISPYDLQKRETSLPEELKRRGFSEVSLYRCGQEKEDLEDRIYEMGVRIEQWKEERARKAPAKEPGEKAKAPASEKRPGDQAMLPPVSMTREGLQSLFAQLGSSKKSLTSQGLVLSPEAAGAELRGRPRTGLTPGQERFLAELRKRQAETKLDLRQQPLGVLRRAAESVLGKASARLREFPSEPSALRSLLLVERDPERKQRIAALVSRLPVRLEEESSCREQEAYYRAYRGKTEKLVCRIPEIPHPWEVSVEKPQAPFSGQKHSAIDRNRGIDRGGR
ncbi:hypothetical protein MAMC_00690 [Methylacidimicrobium cyclopophantes]|uniref:Uncharacterized protein n=1 Tax=Methylacidimicrobium cyclopophantes TaxID=1041766 RepID=A0A5E6MB77_9BACT|nr:hypothetical protein [Methylacidimicrobium cyclopophantes]VVM05579.1 hypothetical protein MAMC_00690 [Methylacidimicrobium cyclopophantes]